MPIKRLSPSLLLLAALAACDGGGTEPDPQVVRVFVSPTEQTINRGETLQLSATGRDEDNLVVAGSTFQWSTLDPGVATVSGTGLVSGVGGGLARIVATASTGVADTAEITVVAPAAQCNEAGATPELAVGQSATLQGSAAGTVCLSGLTSGAEYVVVPFHGTMAREATLGVRFDPVGVMATSGPPNPSLVPFGVSGGLAQAAAAPARGDGGFHTRLNQRARESLSRRVPDARNAFRRRGGAAFQVQAAPPAVGTVLSLNVNADDACANPDFHEGEVVAVSNKAVVVADKANPTGGFTAADYAHIAATFDTLIYPVNVAAFGEPQDIDDNGRVIIFYTRGVNELTPPNANYIVGGFFYGRDLFPRTAPNPNSACTGSNVAEMFYMLAPDPSGQVNNNPRSLDDVRRSTLSVVGHEFQHLISASRRLYVVPGVDNFDWSEEPFLNEGLSHIAEELLFYHRAQRGPRQNLTSEILNVQPARAAFIEFQQSNYGRYGEYLENPDQDSPFDAAFGEEDDLATRGASWAFLRYAADRRNGDDNALWFALVNSPLVGMENLQAQLGQPPLPLYRDFAVSVYTDDAVTGVPPVFTQPSWHHRSLYQAIQNGYPLEVRPLAGGVPTTLTLVAGGSAYLRAGVAGGQRASIQVTAAGAPPPATLSVTVVRTK